MSKTAIIFSPEGGSVNQVAIKLGDAIGNDKVDIIPVREIEKEDINNHSQLIFIGSTVGADHWSNKTLVNEWPGLFSKIADISFEDKKVAIVGLGNSILYPSHFGDGMANLYEELSEKNASIYGFVDAADYTFEDSEALDDEGYFCGLALDEDNEEELTEGRIERWISMLKSDFEF
ncbi:MAG: flavodoxin domain-containing protein [Bacteroidales bacterium]